MKIRGNSNAWPIALALVAVVIAGSGTAVAVTAATTTISDPTTPSRKAHVDAKGRLLTSGLAAATSTIVGQGSFANSGTVILTSPTTASLALTELLISETRLNGTTNGADLTVRLVQLSVGTNGSCTLTATRFLTVTALSSGDQVQVAPTTPIVVKPVGTAKYCLGIYSVVTNGVADATNYYPYVAWSAYAVSGTYTGIGTAASPAIPPLPAKKKR